MARKLGSPSKPSRAKPPARWSFEPIGIVTSCFKEKFGIPRQPGLVPEAQATIKLKGDPDLKTALRSIETFSHLWLIFVFHEHGSHKWKPSIRPPRLGGATKVGVLASRSPHRPNPIGLSVVRLEAVNLDAPGGPELRVSGHDLLDGTPILDLKPYLPYADSLPDAKGGWAQEPIRRTPVEFTLAALEQIARISQSQGPEYARFKELIVEMLEIDPRPAFQQRRMPPDSAEAQGTRFGFKLLSYDVKWEIRDGKFLVTQLDSSG